MSDTLNNKCTNRDYSKGAHTKLIASDCDGTIIDFSFRPKKSLIKAVHKVVESGNNFILATGRSPELVISIAKELHLDGLYAVCSNGAVTIKFDFSKPEGYEMCGLTKFDPKEVLMLIKQKMPDTIFGVEDLNPHRFRVNKISEEAKLGHNQEAVSFENLYSKPVSRVVVYDPKSESAEFNRQVATMGLESISYSIGWGNWLDIAPRDISKSVALEAVRQELKIPIENTYAFGDGMNDISMIEWANVGYAVDNAFDELKRVADKIAPSVSREGIAGELYKIIEE
jgi:Cof subfamily protein (haloacid dehalogenase superfamily)